MLRRSLLSLPIIATLLFLATGSSVELDAQTRIGTVKTETIVAAMPQFKQVEQRVTALQKSYLDTMNALKNQYDQEFQSYRENEAGMVQADKAAKEQRLIQLQQQLQQYQETRLGQQGWLMQYQAQLLAPVRQMVVDAIKAVAQQEKLSTVMEETSVLYIDPNLDITFKVLEYIKKSQG